MTVEFKKGDVIATEDVDAYAQSCDCAGLMATPFKEEFPRMYHAYLSKVRAGLFNPGDLFMWEGPDGQVIFNLGAHTGRVSATIPALKSSIEKMLDMAEANGISTIAMPRVGARFGGMAWMKAKKALIKMAEARDIKLIVAEQHVPGQSLL
jgi:hypothetical protein